VSGRVTRSPVEQRFRDADGVRYESFIHSRWEHHSAALVWITMRPDSGDAYPVSELEAARIRKRAAA